MIAMMEKYANNLEALVDERTDQLVEEKKKTGKRFFNFSECYTARNAVDFIFKVGYPRVWFLFTFLTIINRGNLYYHYFMTKCV